MSAGSLHSTERPVADPLHLREKSAIANSHFTGPLLRQVLAELGIDLQKVQSADDMHIHFETSQKCEDAEFYGSSLPLAMAL